MLNVQRPTSNDAEAMRQALPVGLTSGSGLSTID
jgi:hypothetical protein